MIFRKKPDAIERPEDWPPNLAKHAAQALIESRISLGPATRQLTKLDISKKLAVRWLDLVMVVSVRFQFANHENIIFPSEYETTRDLGLTKEFSECLITKQLMALYGTVDNLAESLSIFAKDIRVIAQHLENNPDGVLSLAPPRVGYGSQVRHGRLTFSSEAVKIHMSRQPQIDFDSLGSTPATAESIVIAALKAAMNTRLNLKRSVEQLLDQGHEEDLGLRCLDLVMVLASRTLMAQFPRVFLLDSYQSAVKLDLPCEFSECQISAELDEIFAQKPDLVGFLAPLSYDLSTVNEAMHKEPNQPFSLRPATVGDGSQIKWARLTLGEDGVDSITQMWPRI